jgi:hypothetical protein
MELFLIVLLVITKSQAKSLLFSVLTDLQNLIDTMLNSLGVSQGPGYPFQVLDQFRYHSIGLWAFHYYPSRKSAKRPLSFFINFIFFITTRISTFPYLAEYFYKLLANHYMFYTLLLPLVSRYLGMQILLFYCSFLCKE